jgi:hypothetical protein
MATARIGGRRGRTTWTLLPRAGDHERLPDPRLAAAIRRTAAVVSAARQAGTATASRTTASAHA